MRSSLVQAFRGERRELTRRSSQGVTDTLRSGRDGVFYVESDVNFKLDPYPMLEPFFDTADLLIAENATSPLAGHVNSGTARCIFCSLCVLIVSRTIRLLLDAQLGDSA